jgi:D-lactate dehydrogenase (cytochrome)
VLQVAGVITKVAIQCATKMTESTTSLFALTSFKKVIGAHALAKQRMSQALSAFEFLDAESMQLVLKHVPFSKKFFLEDYPMYILVEASGATPNAHFPMLRCYTSFCCILFRLKKVCTRHIL